VHDYELTHLSNTTLLRSLAALVQDDRRTTAMLLAHIAEVDARQLYREPGCSSMHAYCVDKLRLSDDAAFKRIQAARAARQFPGLFVAIADGRLHLTAVCLLAPHLTSHNAEELIEFATHRRKSDIEAWLVTRFEVVRDAGPVRPLIRAIPGVPPAPAQLDGPQLGLTAVDGELAVALPQVDGDGCGELAPAQVGESAVAPAPVGGGRSELAPAPVGGGGGLGPAQVGPVPGRYLLRLAISKSTHDKLRRAQELLSHAVPGGDVAQVLDRALDALIAEVQKKRFGVRKEHQRAGRRGADHSVAKPKSPSQAKPKENPRPQRPRHIPAAIRRAVWERDRAQCTFLSPNGERCEARHFLEFDHVKPIARGGKPTVSGLRLRCQAHNQYEAERAFGPEFMRRKREKARRVAAERREQASRATPEVCEGLPQAAGGG
jgi:5-methylcytosine-specific restriction endonuclease McrA